MLSYFPGSYSLASEKLNFADNPQIYRERVPSSSTQSSNAPQFVFQIVTLAASNCNAAGLVFLTLVLAWIIGWLYFFALGCGATRCYAKAHGSGPA